MKISGDKKNGLERAASSIFTFFLATIPYELGWLEVKWPKLWDPSQSWNLMILVGPSRPGIFCGYLLIQIHQGSKHLAWQIESHPMPCFPKHVLPFPLDWQNFNGVHFKAKNSLNFSITLQTLPTPISSLLSVQGEHKTEVQPNFKVNIQNFAKNLL